MITTDMDVQASVEKTDGVKTKKSMLTYLTRILRYIYSHANIFFVCIKLTTLTLFLIYIAIPIFVRANQWILPKVVFSNLIRWPPFINLSNPSEFGLNNTRNFHLEVDKDVTIGAWHILPKSMHIDNVNIPWDAFEDELDNGKQIFLYLHGNSGTRGSYHRVQLYNLLSKLDFHVVTIDYRGFGDSSGEPTENGVVHDAYFTYKWLKQRVGDSKIFIWGHSLGTGVTTKLAKKLCEEGDRPAGIVLESPFNNIQEAAFHHPFSSPYRMLPWFEWVFVEGIGEHGIFFNSEENILSVTPHILILHAKDDYIVPFHLGEKLYMKAKDTRSHKTGSVEFISFEGHHGYGHKLIYKSPELPQIVRQFVSHSKTSQVP
ncbi:lysophosphatidylserine lipase ABHD12-like [Physella acuta]|uniref:lysophosphatidylserine lipase ABHD12-like n=1 Tax=Physella acuta TaxID=109671 RepID=UPI0027DB4D5F|nr:lysophosphatidylserine lipase ABHD12-like [Physella acuta]